MFHLFTEKHFESKGGRKEKEKDKERERKEEGGKKEKENGKISGVRIEEIQGEGEIRGGDKTIEINMNSRVTK